MSQTTFSHELLVEHITKNILQTLQELPGNSYIGPLPVKHKIAKPASKDELRAQFRSAIEKKFNEKWKP